MKKMLFFGLLRRLRTGDYVGDIGIYVLACFHQSGLAVFGLLLSIQLFLLLFIANLFTLKFFERII